MFNVKINLKIFPGFTRRFDRGSKFSKSSAVQGRASLLCAFPLHLSDIYQVINMLYRFPEMKQFIFALRRLDYALRSNKLVSSV